MAKKTHRHRAVELLRCYGWAVEVVEHFERPPGRPAYRKDLFGFIDLLALKPGRTLAVQVTVPKHVPEHFRKIEQLALASACLRAGWAVEIWGIRDRPVKGVEGPMVRSLFLDASGAICSRDASILKG